MFGGYGGVEERGFVTWRCRLPEPFEKGTPSVIWGGGPALLDAGTRTSGETFALHKRHIKLTYNWALGLCRGSSEELMVNGHRPSAMGNPSASVLILLPDWQ